MLLYSLKCIRNNRFVWSILICHLFGRHRFLKINNSDRRCIDRHLQIWAVSTIRDRSCINHMAIIHRISSPAATQACRLRENRIYESIIRPIIYPTQQHEDTRYMSSGWSDLSQQQRHLNFKQLYIFRRYSDSRPTVHSPLCHQIRGGSV